MAEQLRLYSYWRSSAAYRVRIGLNLKGLAYETVPVHLVRDGGQQHAPDYVARNPQHMVPTLQHGVRVIRQSLAILEYLDEAWPSPRLLPMTARDRARVRALALMVACDIHPLNNLRVLQYFEGTWNVPQPERDDWIKHWIVEGFTAMETLLSGDAATGAGSAVRGAGAAAGADTGSGAGGTATAAAGAAGSWNQLWRQLAQRTVRPVGPIAVSGTT